MLTESLLCPGGAVMWEATVRAEREQLIDSPPEKVWELAGSPAALSLFPGWFAFGVPGVVPGTDRLCCLLVSGQSGFHRRALDIRRVRCVAVDVREEIPGRLISWQVRSTEPAGKQVFTLSLHPRAGGSAVRIAISDVITRNLVAGRQPYWRRHVKTWLSCLRAAAEGRAPWPQDVMPAAMQRALAYPAPPRKPVEASAAVVIDGAPGAVWEVALDAASARLADPEWVAWAGHVPGTPLRQAGEMQYFVNRHPGGRFTASVDRVTELADGHRMVIRHIGKPFEGVTVVAPAPGGTRLELTARWPGACRARPERAGSAGSGARAVAGDRGGLPGPHRTALWLRQLDHPPQMQLGTCWNPWRHSLHHRPNRYRSRVPLLPARHESRQRHPDPAHRPDGSRTAAARTAGATRALYSLPAFER